MSLQLIQTRALESAQATSAKTGMVQRSQLMPVCLEERLLQLNDHPSPQPLAEREYRYRILQYAAETYHVLSCLQATREGHQESVTSHHLALSKEEVRQLNKYDTRPTPSGMILALEQLDFWQDCCKKELQPCSIFDLPMPDASVQDHWKQHTGHKSNAKIFTLPPYHEGCLVITPTHLGARDILTLLHESDWLDLSHGWGKTFSTSGNKSEDPLLTKRIFLPENTDLLAQKSLQNRSILRLSKDNLIPSGDAPSPSPPAQENSKLVPSVSFTPSPAKASPSELRENKKSFIIPYHYTEDADRDIYALYTKRKRHKWLMGLCSIVILTLALTAAILKIAQPDKQSESEPPALPIKERITAPSQQADSQQHNTAGKEALRDKKQVPHEAKLTAPAPQLPQQLILPPSTSKEHLATEKLQPILAGEASPEALLKLLKKAPMIIKEGSLRLGNLEGFTLHYTLSANSNHLVIESISPHHYRLILRREGKDESSLPIELICNTQSQHLLVDGKPGYLYLQIQENQEEKQTLLFLPQIEPCKQPLTSVKKPSISLPISPQTVKLTRVPHAKLELKEMADTPPNIELPLPLGEQTSFTLPSLPELGDNTILLTPAEPSLYKYSIQQEASTHECIEPYCIKISKTIELGSWLKEQLEALANTPYCDQGQTEHPFYSLASMYGILARLSSTKKPKEKEKYILQYQRLFESKNLTKLLQTGIKKQHNMLLSPEALKSKQGDALLAKQYISAQLNRPEVCKRLQEALCELIAEKLIKKLIQEQRAAQENDSARPEEWKIHVQKIEATPEGLHWHLSFKTHE